MLTKEEIRNIEILYSEKVYSGREYTYVPASGSRRNMTHIVFDVVRNGKRVRIVRQTAAWRVEANICRKLIVGIHPESETIDHIDGNPLNDDISNLQIVSRSKNAKLSSKQNTPEVYNSNCIMCGTPIILSGKSLFKLKTKLRMGRNGPFCSTKCSGKYGVIVQNKLNVLLFSNNICLNNTHYTIKERINSFNTTRYIHSDISGDYDII